MRNAFGVLACIGLLLLAGCGGQASPATELALASTATLLPPTATPVLPTATPVPPTETPLSPTATPVPPTATPVPPTATPLPPTSTPGPPTATPGPSPTATPTPASCEEAEGVCLQLTFDGESCTYAGPTDVQRGGATLIFINASTDAAAVNLLRHMPGYTHQDMLDIFGEDGTSTWHAPAWTVDYGTWKQIQPGKMQVWRRVLYPGIHTLVCARDNPFLVWYGAGLTVGE
jgi:hypothetical protein